MRIALLAVLAFAGLWLVALRPKPGGTAAPPTAAEQKAAPKPAAKPAAKGVTGAAAKAETAVAKANGATAKRETTAAKTSEGAAAAKPAVAAAKPAAATATAAAKPATPAKVDATPKAVKAVLADVEKGKVVVLLFWNSKLDDDREVKRAIDGIDRHDGKVVVRRASIDDLGGYEPITRGVPVVTNPTTLVIGRDRRARAVAGLTVTREIDQLVDRALTGK